VVVLVVVAEWQGTVSHGHEGLLKTGGSSTTPTTPRCSRQARRCCLWRWWRWPSSGRSAEDAPTSKVVGAACDLAPPEA